MTHIHHGLRVTLQPGYIRGMFYLEHGLLYFLHNHPTEGHGGSPASRPAKFKYSWLLTYGFDSRDPHPELIARVHRAMHTDTMIPMCLCPKEPFT